MTIALEAVTVSFPGADGPVSVLAETTLTLEERRVALIGPNGSGKSTLARLVNGLVTATSGRVLVDGLDPDRDGREVRRRVGFAFTDPAAQLVMPTAVEDVALSLRRTHPDKEERRRAALDLLDQAGLAGLGDRSVHALSGGQRQLLALTGVLATNPTILVADEPTTLLDLRNARVVAEALDGVDQQVIVVTHQLSLLESFERVIVIDDGAVAFDGPPGDAVAAYRAAVE